MSNVRAARTAVMHDDIATGVVAGTTLETSP